MFVTQGKTKRVCTLPYRCAVERNIVETKYLATRKQEEDIFNTEPVWQSALCAFLDGVFSSLASSKLIYS